MNSIAMHLLKRPTVAANVLRTSQRYNTVYFNQMQQQRIVQLLCRRSFSTENKKQQDGEEKNTQELNEAKNEKQNNEQAEEEFEDQAQYKTYRRVLYFIGKTLKYTAWATFSVFLYHWFLIKKYDKPDTAMLVSQPFLEAARFVDWSIYDFKVLMTKPGMTKMLPDRLNIPGQQHPKTLVLNFSGTLVHQKYTMGVGVELFKRPGLSMFLNRMSKYYEIVIFGMGEQGVITEACMALDPNRRMIMGAFGREQTVLKDGQYIKDLTYLNRPLNEIIYIDFEDEAVKYHKENAIILPKFQGEEEDRSLIDLVPFLERKSLLFSHFFDRPCIVPRRR
jgi:hypothetical protein